MTDRVRPSSGPIATPRPSGPVKAPEAQAGTGVAADALNLRAQPAIEADVRVALRGGTRVDAAGTVAVKRDFVIRLVKDVLRDPQAFSQIDVRHDPATGAFAASGKVRWMGVSWPIAMQARPQVIGGQLAVRFEEPRLRVAGMQLPMGAMTGIAQDLVMKHLNRTRIQAQVGADKATILMEPTSLLHEIGVLPAWLRLDPQRTKLAIETGPTGDMLVKLDSPTAPAAAAATPASDVVVAIDEAGLQAVLARAFEPLYDLKALKLREDGMAVKGETDYRPVSDALTAAKGILIMFAIANGQRGALNDANTGAVVAKGPLDLDVRVANGTVFIKPSISLAAKDMVAELGKLGLPATHDRGVIQVKVADAERAFGAELRQLRIGPDGVSLQAGLDVEQLIRNPRLLAP